MIYLQEREPCVLDSFDRFERADEVMRRSAPALKRAQAGYWIEPTPSSPSSVSYPSLALDSLAAVEPTSFWFSHRNAIIASIIARYPPGGAILDIGGGNGCVAMDLDRRGLQIIVLEPDAGGALTAYHRGLPVIAASFRRQWFVSGSIAAVGLFDVVEHIKDDVSFLRDCAAILRPGGLLYLTVPALPPLWSADDAYAGHFRRYRRCSLSLRLREAGFDVITIGYFFTCLVPAILMCRTVPSILRLRRVAEAKQAVAHHAVNFPFARAVGWALDFEARRAVNGRFMPLGSSLVAVASAVNGRHMSD